MKINRFIFSQVGPETNRGNLSSFILILHGTKEPPAYLDNGPRRYNQDYNKVHKKVSVFKTVVFKDHFQLLSRFPNCAISSDEYNNRCKMQNTQLCSGNDSELRPQFAPPMTVRVLAL
jgi:hypothetical protein